ncbi:RidA family protein [Rubrobacter tropicus]|uniref:RidA family protein n=1 Tax=Rubrobacter tropicus TaxID=2653851 RepID=UPI00140BE320|nr:RidA family protein [Rubrobacter tropicus]
MYAEAPPVPSTSSPVWSPARVTAAPDASTVSGLVPSYRLGLARRGGPSERNPLSLAQTPGLTVPDGFESLETILEAAGSGPGNAVEVNAYLSDRTPFAQFDAVFREFFGDGPPARTIVGFGLPGLLAGIDRVAVLEESPQVGVRGHPHRASGFAMARLDLDGVLQGRHLPSGLVPGSLMMGA